MNTIVDKQTELFKNLNKLNYNALKITRSTGINRNKVWRSQSGIRELKLSEYFILVELLREIRGY